MAASPLLASARDTRLAVGEEQRRPSYQISHKSEDPEEKQAFLRSAAPEGRWGGGGGGGGCRILVERRKNERDIET